MSKITNLMRRTALVSSLTGTLIIGATATANASAEQAPVAVASAGVSHVAQDDDPVTIQSASDCTNYLETWGYTLTNTRRTICALASFPFPSAQTRIAACIPAMLATGVGTVVAPISCILATAP